MLQRAEVIRRYRELAAECWAIGGQQTDPHEWNSAQMLGATLDGWADELEEVERGLSAIGLPDLHRGEVQHSNGLEVPGVPRQDVVVPFRQRGRVQGGVRIRQGVK